jgi:hypothetical protein
MNDLGVLCGGVYRWVWCNWHLCYEWTLEWYRIAPAVRQPRPQEPAIRRQRSFSGHRECTRGRHWDRKRR